MPPTKNLLLKDSKVNVMTGGPPSLQRTSWSALRTNTKRVFWMKNTPGASSQKNRRRSIHSLKKDRGGTSGKTNKPKQATKKQAPKKEASKKTMDQKRPVISGPGKSSPQKNRTPKNMMLMSKLLRTKSNIGVQITTMAQECGHYTTQNTARVAQEVRK